MASNPHQDARVCGGTKVILYVADTEADPTKMPKFMDDTLEQARAKLIGALKANVAVKACGKPVERDFTDPTGELRVVAQWPAEESTIDGALNRGELRLAPRLDFRQTFARTTLPIARARLAERAALRGWTLQTIEPAPTAPAPSASAPRAEPVIIDTAIDSDACRITAVLGLPPEPEPPTTAPPPAGPSPELPLAAGALAGLLGGRLLWARGRESAVVVAAAMAASAPAAPRLRVRRDRADLLVDSVPDDMGGLDE